jgi:hypothetical protein
MHIDTMLPDEKNNRLGVFQLFVESCTPLLKDNHHLIEDVLPMSEPQERYTRIRVSRQCLDAVHWA